MKFRAVECGTIQDTPLNTPFGQHVEPHLYYVLTLRENGAGILMGRHEENGQQVTWPLCFGNEGTAASYMQAYELDWETHKIFSGEQIQDFWIFLHIGGEDD